MLALKLSLRRKFYSMAKSGFGLAAERNAYGINSEILMPGVAGHERLSSLREKLSKWQNTHCTYP